MKRPTREQKKEKAVIDIINQMFVIAGHDATYDDIVGVDKWFQQYTMTVEQGEELKECVRYEWVHRKDFLHEPARIWAEVGWVARGTWLTKAQGQIEARIDSQLKQSESLVQKVPSETAKQVAATSDTLKREVQSLSGRLQSQANAVQSLGNEVKALKGSVGNVDGLKRDVEALVTLQRERYLEALQKNNAASAKERALQYPRVQPKGSEAPATSTPAPAPASAPTPAPAAAAASAS